jgi:hypothetical protein
MAVSSDIIGLALFTRKNLNAYYRRPTIITSDDSQPRKFRYEQYFQFRDPIMRPMQRMRRAVGVTAGRTDFVPGQTPRYYS